MASASFLDGLALAATLKGDRGGAAEAGLAPDLASALATRIQEIRSTGRERALGAIAAGLRPHVDPTASLPPRAAAILATEVPRAVGASWMARGPLPRPGFRVPPVLRASLRRLARPARDPAAVAGDREAGRRALADALSATDAPRALILEALGEGGAPASPSASSERRATFARVLGRAARGEALAEALGRAERAASEPTADDRYARAGREMRALWERGCRG